MPAIAMIIDSLLKQIPKAKHIIYKQYDKFIAKSESLGNTKESVVENVPTSFDPVEVQQQLLRAPLIINGDKLLFKNNVDDVILLDNPYNEVCPSAAVVALKQYKILIIVGFQRSAVKINYVDAIYDFVASCERKKIFTNYQVEVQKQEETPLKSYEFQFKSFVVFQNAKLPYLQAPKPYNEQKLVLMTFLDPNSAYFEYHLQKLSKVPTPIYPVTCIATCQSGELFKSMTKRSYFVSQLNVVSDRQNVALRVLQKNDLAYMLFKVPDESDIKQELNKIREAEERQFKLLNAGSGRKYVMTEDHEEVVVKQIMATIEPTMLNMGCDIVKLNQYLRQIEEEIDTSYCYFGERDFAFFGIKLKAFFAKKESKEQTNAPENGEEAPEGAEAEAATQNKEKEAQNANKAAYEQLSQEIQQNVTEQGEDAQEADKQEEEQEDILQIDKDRLFVVFFGNSKHKEFQTHIDQLRELQTVGIQVILVVQNSWEGNMEQLLRKYKGFNDLQLVFDNNNVFRIAQEISGSKGKAYSLFFFENARQLISNTFSIIECYDYENKRIKQRELEREVLEREENLRALGSSQVVLKSRYTVSKSEINESCNNQECNGEEGAEGEAEAGEAVEGQLNVEDLAK